MQILIALLLAALTHGCVSYEDYLTEVTDGLKSWQGAHKDTLIATWGAPQSASPLQNGEMLTYVFSDSEGQLDPKALKSISQPTCRYSFQLNKQGQIIDAEASGHVGGCAKFMRYNSLQDLSLTVSSSVSTPMSAPPLQTATASGSPELSPLAGKPKAPRGTWALKRNLCLDGKVTGQGQTLLDQMNLYSGTALKFAIDFDSKIYTVEASGCLQKGPFKLSAKGGRLRLLALPGGTGQNCPAPAEGVERILELRETSIYLYLPPNSQICDTGHLVQEFERVSN